MVSSERDEEIGMTRKTGRMAKKLKQTVDFNIEKIGEMKIIVSNSINLDPKILYL